jgi:hypothetical protein
MLSAAGALAQTPEPSVTPFPVEVKRTTSGFSKKELEELQKDFVRLLRKVALVPDNASYEVAIKELKRQDCDREDECLQQLAVKGQTLYAVYASVDYTVSGQIVAQGRVVRDDGKLAGGPATITIAKGRSSFRDMARVALTRLLDDLKVAGLNPSRPVPVPVPDVPVVVKPAPVELPPPPPPIVMQPLEPRANPVRVIAWSAAGVGAAALIAGVVVFATAPTVTKQGNLVVASDASKVVAAQGQQAAGVGLMVAGGAVAIAGVTVALISKDGERVKASMVPMPGGATFVLGGAF